MKKSFFIYSSFLLFIIGFLSYRVNVILNQSPNIKKIEMSTFKSSHLPISYQPKQQRKDITFILGSDQNLNNPYYSNAENYYRNHPSEKTEWVVSTCRSLVEVNTFLEQHARSNPWGKINLVVHSNEWMGMGLPIDENGGRTTVESVDQALEDSTIQPLSNDVIDRATVIHINGCGLGKDSVLLAKLAIAFGGNDEDIPTIQSSKYFVTYAIENGQPKKYYTAYYPMYFKTGYKPANSIIANQLAKQHPNDNTPFQDALSRKSPRFQGDAYHYFFNVPVNWVVSFSSIEERPSLNNQKEEMAFLAQQDELLEVVKAHNIPLDKFRWQFKTIDYTFDDGTSEPAILIKGKSSVLCVLQSITKPNSTEPFEPARDNKTFFTSIVPAPKKSFGFGEIK